MENQITITVKAYGITHSASLSDDCSAIEFIEIFSNMAESCCFSPQLVIQGLKYAIENRI